MAERNYYWLNANPNYWLLRGFPVGKSQEYTIYNENGNKRSVFKNFIEAKVGDILVAYQGNPIGKIIAIFKVSEEVKDPDDKKSEIGMIKVLDIQDGVAKNELTAEGVTATPLKNGSQGSLFKLEDEDYETIVRVIEKKNPSLLSEMEMDAPLKDKIEALTVDQAVDIAKQNGSYYMGWSIPIGKVFTKYQLYEQLGIDYRNTITFSEMDHSAFFIHHYSNNSPFYWIDEYEYVWSATYTSNSNKEGTIESYPYGEYVHTVSDLDNDMYQYIGVSKLSLVSEKISEERNEEGRYTIETEFKGTMVNDVPDIPEDMAYIE